MPSNLNEPGGTNALSATGGSHTGNPAPQGKGTRNDSKDDVEAMLEDGTRKRGAGVVNEAARDAAGVPPPNPPRHPDEDRPSPEERVRRSQEQK